MPSNSSDNMKLNKKSSKTGTTEEKINFYLENVNKAKQGGGKKRVEVQHSKGKYTARERNGTNSNQFNFHSFNTLLI